MTRFITVTVLIQSRPLVILVGRVITLTGSFIRPLSCASGHELPQKELNRTTFDEWGDGSGVPATKFVG
jgi:hypothetical protein